MDFTDDQKAVMREQARVAIQEFQAIHIQTCPWGKRISRIFWILVGALVVSGILNMSAIAALVKVMPLLLAGGP